MTLGTSQPQENFCATRCTVKQHKIPNPVVHPCQVLTWLQDVQHLAKETGSSSFKEMSIPPSSTPAYFMSSNCDPRNCIYLQIWHNLTKWLLWRMFQLDKIVYLRSVLESRCSQINTQNGIPILTGMQKPPKGLKIPK